MTTADRILLEAAGRGDDAGVRGALTAGARIESRDENLRTPLLLAALGDHVPVARTLIEAGADPDAQDSRHDSAWLVTGVTGSVAMMRVLLRGDPDVRLRNRFGGVSVIPASERGHVAYVRAVLAETAIDVNHVNNLGWTALLEAVILGDGGPAHQEIVEVLLAAGARPELADADGVTALLHAERRGYEEIAALLRAAR
ncbi:ankyrin repeat domain-containing protein [Streptomyces amakusaensis]|uniref:Ankyrin repeat domain-containing protein n=1 Tax=Streptomyces amakusaensis TaxID=67271 RepID=A0ABW0AI70_9ACTN